VNNFVFIPLKFKSLSEENYRVILFVKKQI